jgi:hypothetical protein
MRDGEFLVVREKEQKRFRAALRDIAARSGQDKRGQEAIDGWQHPSVLQAVPQKARAFG